MARGSIEKRVGKSGAATWTARWSFIDPATGIRRQRRSSHATKRAAEAALAKALDGGEAAPATLTVRAWVEEWLAQKRARVAYSTWLGYRGMLRTYIVPRLGNVPLGRLHQRHISACYAAAFAAGLSPTTVNKIHLAFNTCLNDAARAGLLQFNPARLAERPRPERKEMQVWTPDQVRRVLTAGDQSELAALWRLALLGGLRKGELLALRWDDLDLDRAMVSVKRGRARGPDGPVETTTKTAASRRPIALPASCVVALRRHRARQALAAAEHPAWQGDPHVFVGPHGRRLSKSTLDDRYNKLVQAAGVPRIRFHDMRHTCATLLLALGVSPKVVAERLGHADVNITLNRYSHLLSGMQEHAAALLDAALADLPCPNRAQMDETEVISRLDGVSWRV